MNPISTDTQRKFMYIPIVNMLTTASTLFNCICVHPPPKIQLKIFPYLFGYTIPAALFWMILAKLLPSLQGLFSICTMYITPLAMSYGLIKYQEKYLDL